MSVVLQKLLKGYLFLFAVSFSAFLIGCQPLVSQSPTPSTVNPAMHPTPLSTPRPISTAADTIASNPVPTVITLTFWTVDRFSPQIDLVAQQLAAFQTAYPAIHLKTYLKKSTGQAGILNYLKSAKDVAPGIMPDIIVLPGDQLPQAWRSGLIQSLDGKLDRTMVQDLLPAARTLGIVDNQLVGIPFEMDVEHLAYNTTEITITPVVWTDVLSSGVPYQFPAGGQSELLNDASLIQYLSADGQLTNDQGEPIIDEPALRALLTFYHTAATQKLISPAVLKAAQADDQWSAYLTNPHGMIHVTAHRYLENRRQLTTVQAGPIPARNAHLITIGHSWAFALVTQDPNRQNQALKVIETLMQTDLNAAWATRSAVIPTRQSAFNLVAGDDPYWAFLNTYLTTTIAPPSFTGFDQVSRILQQAVKQVISGEATVDEAVFTASGAL